LLKPLYKYITSSLGNDASSALETQIIEDDYNMEGITEVINDDDELNEFVDAISYDNKDKLKDAMKAYVSNVNDNDSKDDSKTDDNTLTSIGLKELVNIYKENSNINSDTMRQFIQEINCDAIWHDTDKVYTDWLAISIKTGKQHESILQMLGDHYTRYYIKKYIDIGKHIPVSNWANDPNVLKGLQSHGNMFVLVKTALESYFKRLNQAISLPPTQLINDDINVYGNIIHAVFEFIKTTIKNYDLPVQFDFVILPKDIETSNDDDDDYGDPDSDDDKTDRYGFDNGFEDAFEEFNDNEVIKTHINYSKIKRELMANFDALIKAQKLNKQSVRNKRFAFVFDRQIDSNDDGKPNSYVFIPKRGNIIPTKYIPQSFLVNSHFIVKTKSSKIGANNADIYCLSFHCCTKDVIKCYQYWGSKMCRFDPNDTINVWPYIFSNKNSCQQKLNNDIQNNINNINDVLKDDMFDTFLK